MVAAEDDRRAPLLDRPGDRAGDPLAGLLDLVEEARLRAPARGRFRDDRVHVPPVIALDAELLETILEARVANRRRAHVDAAAPGAEVERGADDRRLPLLSVRHGP